MARLTWLGEDHLHTVVTKDGVSEFNAGPSFTTWAGIKFPKGEPVEVKESHLIAKAKNNPFFKVEGLPGRPPKPLDDDV